MIMFFISMFIFLSILCWVWVSIIQNTINNKKEYREFVDTFIK